MKNCQIMQIMHPWKFVRANLRVKLPGIEGREAEEREKVEVMLEQRKG